MADGKNVKGQIIVSGASRGIGAAIAAELAGAGYAVVGLSRSGDNPHGQGIACDVCDDAAVRDAFAQVAAQGPIVGLVNNAGLHLGSPSHALTTDEYETVMRINATALMVGCREIHRYLKEHGGTIVNMGSFFDKLGVPGNLAYCASKAAVGAITRCLAVEWASHNIRVLNVAPGYIETDLNRDFLARPNVQSWLKKRIPQARAGTPEEVARLVLTLFTPGMDFLTGETIYIDGGQGMNH